MGRAVADSPEGPFTDADEKPLVCQTEEGGSIDASPFRDGDGKLCLYWKNDGNAIGLDTYIYGQELSPDGLNVVGEAVRLFKQNEAWEGQLVEAPFMWKRDGGYYLFFSANAYYNESYAEGYATCKGPLGPCEKALENPSLETADGAAVPGHASIIETEKGETWLAYHAWPPEDIGSSYTGRVLWIDRLEWRDGRPVVQAQRVNHSPRQSELSHTGKRGQRIMATVRFSNMAVISGLVVAFCIPFSAVGDAREATGSYTNPVSKDFADTFADPVVIKAKDGYWYAYGTTDPLREGEKEFHTIPISRSKDLVSWEYVGDAFGEPTELPWADTDAALWAPDIRYLNGKYYMYYVVTQTTATLDRDDNAIGVATAPTPAGPWTDSGEPVVGPRRGGSGNNFKWTFDPSEFTDSDGTRYLYYGSYYGGIFVTELSADGKRAVGEPTMVAIDNRYEAAYVVKREGYYYLFGSSSNCCAGPTTGYSVYVGRSESPEGPFLDRQGVSMMESRVGGSIVVTPNGNKWVGTGHNSIVTDLSGQDYFAYHAIDRADPYLDEPFGINERPMLLDRLDWIGGWPTVRSGAWASEDVQPAPATNGPVKDSFNGRNSLGRDWQSDGGGWRLVKEWDGQGYVRRQGASSQEAFLVNQAALPPDVRIESDARTAGGKAAGGVVRYKDGENYAAAWLDRTANSLVTDVVVSGKSLGRQSVALPNDFTFGEWHNVAVEARGTKMTVEVTDARLQDPYAVTGRTLPPTLADGKAGLMVRGRADFDNASAVELHVPHSKSAEMPQTSAPLSEHSDEFNGTVLEPAWRWVREQDGRESGGAFRWQTQEGDIVGTGNNASVLLRDAPEGDYIVETKLTIDLGVEAIRNYQQAGLIAYANDDLWTRLSHVAIWNTRQTEFGKEMPFAGGLSFGGMLIGPPSETTYLRLAHHLDSRSGEHEFRAATSRDGKNWVWGGTWTLPAGPEPQIGLISLGKNPNDAAATAEFNYFRVYRTNMPAG